jgi:enoyl-CoA hydratase/carnithine racemase
MKPEVTKIALSGYGSAALSDELLERAGALARSAETAIVLEGDTRSFCTGLDLEGFAEGNIDLSAASSQFGNLLSVLAGVSVPVIAIVEGEALGGGLGLVAVADYVIAHPRARFGLPESMLGLIPAMVFPWIARRAGLSVTRRLALGVAPIGAAEALRVGLIDEISDAPSAAAATVLNRFRKMDSRAVAEIKRLIATHHKVSPGWLTDSAASFALLAASDATQTRIRRFVACETPWREGNDEA